MSISFFIADKAGRQVRECDCRIRYAAAHTVWWQNRDLAASDEPDPFQYECSKCRMGVAELNLNNRNAADLVRWLDLGDTEWGQISASDLAAKCRRRMWDESRNHDASIEGQEYKVPGGIRVIEGPRPEGYLRGRVEQLLKLAEKAGDNMIAWG